MSRSRLKLPLAVKLPKEKIGKKLLEKRIMNTEKAREKAKTFVSPKRTHEDENPCPNHTHSNGKGNHHRPISRMIKP